MKSINEDTAATSTNEATLSTWEMACSILVALGQAEDRARSEYIDRVAEAKGKPFGKGVTPAAHLLEALSEALRNLEPDLRAIARANGYSMPAGNG